MKNQKAIMSKNINLFISYPKAGATLSQIMLYLFHSQKYIFKSTDFTEFVEENNIGPSGLVKTHSTIWANEVSQINKNIRLFYISRNLKQTLTSYAKHMILDGNDDALVFDAIDGFIQSLENEPSLHLPYGGWLYQLMWAQRNNCRIFDFSDIQSGAFIEAIYGNDGDVDIKSKIAFSLSGASVERIAEIETYELLNRVPGAYYNEKRRRSFLTTGARFTGFKFIDARFVDHINSRLSSIPKSLVEKINKIDPMLIKDDCLSTDNNLLDIKRFYSMPTDRSDCKLFNFPFWRSDSLLEQSLLTASPVINGKCNICCGEVSFRFGINLRDTGVCSTCNSTNRDRQIAFATKELISVNQTSPFPDSIVGSLNVLQIGFQNTYSNIFPDKAVCKTFYSTSVVAGSIRDGIRCEDLTRLTFPNETFDYVYTSDILEHINSFDTAFSEISRVLKTGGRHIFTVPFDAHSILNDRKCFGYPHMTAIWPDKQYHSDDDGSLIPVYQIFGWELFVDCAKHGLSTSALFINAPQYGIVGPNAVVFISKKII